MRKYIGTAALLAAAVFMLCSCGLSSGSADDGAVSAPTESVQAQITVAEVLGEINNDLLDGSAVKGEELFDKNAEKFYSIDISQIEDGGILYSTSGANADEVSVIRLNDDTNAQEILESRLAGRHSTFDGYAPEEMPKLESAEIFTQNGFAVLIISDEHEAIAKQIKDKLD